MKGKWLSSALVVVGLVCALLGEIKGLFPDGSAPVWVLRVSAAASMVLAILRGIQDLRGLLIGRGIAGLAADIEPDMASPPKQFDERARAEIAMLQGKVDRAPLGKPKLFRTPSISADTWYHFGLLAFNQRDFKRAKKYLRAALAREPRHSDSVDLFLQISVAWAKQKWNDVEHRRRELGEARELVERVSPHWSARTQVLAGYVYGALAMDCKESDPSAARDYWHRAATSYRRVLDPVAGAVNGMGNFLWAQGKLEDAIQMHEMALSLEPDYTAAANDATLVCRTLARNHPQEQDAWGKRAAYYQELAIALSRTDPQFAADYDAKIRGGSAPESGESQSKPETAVPDA